VKRRSSYKLTFFDRHGPGGALRLKAAGQAIVVFGFSSLMFFVLGAAPDPGFGLGGWRLIVFTLVSSGTLSGIALFVSTRTAGLAGDAAERVYMGGNSTPYEDSFSQEESLVMQRDYAGALHLFEQRIKETPKYAKLLIAAADLYATHGENPKRACELYKEVQRLPDVAAGQDIYVSNKLADLYLGKLKEPGRALVEFRRLMSRYPDSVTAKHAKSAIDNLKPDLVQEPGAKPKEPESRVW
jgi:tetratricopeptide (TPR) repeat protein